MVSLPATGPIPAFLSGSCSLPATRPFSANLASFPVHATGFAPSRDAELLRYIWFTEWCDPFSDKIRQIHAYKGFFKGIGVILLSIFVIDFHVT